MLESSVLQDFLVRIYNTVEVCSTRCVVLVVTTVNIGLTQLTCIVIIEVVVQPVLHRIQQLRVVHTECLRVIQTVGVLVSQHSELHSGDHVVAGSVLRQVDRLLPSEVSRIGNLCTILNLRTVLRGDQYNTVSTTGTVDRSRSSVLQNRDVSNVVGVNERKVADLNTVQQDQRLVVTINRSSTTNLNGCRSTKVSSTVGNGQTGNSTLKTLSYINDRLAIESLRYVNRSNCTGQVSLLLSTETYDNNIVDGLRIVCQGYNHTVVSLNSLSNVTNVRDRYLSTFGNCQSEVTVSVGSHTVGLAAHLNYRSTEDRFTCRILNGTRNLD